MLASIVTTIAHTFFTGAVLGTADAVFAFLKGLSKFMIVIAMRAIGLNTNVVRLVQKGYSPLILGLGYWVSISFVSLMLQKVLSLF